MTTELRPCPFCNGTNLDVDERYLQYDPEVLATTVMCEDCEVVHHIDHWNTRPIEDGLRAEIEALQKQVDDTTFMFLERHEAIDELVALGYQFVRAIKDTDRNEAFVEALNKWNEAVKRIRKEREE